MRIEKWSEHMPKGEQKSNREKKKPKQDKNKDKGKAGKK